VSKFSEMTYLEISSDTGQVILKIKAKGNVVPVVK
jgi:hypothetical protein